MAPVAARIRILLSVLVALCLIVGRSECLVFRIYHGREECVGVRLPSDAIEALTEGAERREDRNAQINVMASGGFIVKNAYGAEVDKGVVNVKLTDPQKKVVYSREQASEGDFDVKAPIPVASADGPWEFCFVIAKGEGIMKYKSSLLFELSFLTLELEKMPGKVKILTHLFQKKNAAVGIHGRA
eukprot:jgi/Pico_ML_1/51170/g2249.t1